MIDRRSFLVASAGTMVAGPLHAASGNRITPLWTGRPPGGGGPVGSVETSAKGAISNITVPSLELFEPRAPMARRCWSRRGAAISGSRWRARRILPPAGSRGITAFVLSYRLPPEGWEDGPLAPLQDAQRAVRLIRALAARYRIHPARVGVLGFSAGGHLLGLASTRSAFNSYRAVDAIDAGSARPDVAALIYPVITLKPPYDHTSTRRSLIGDHPDARASAEWSVETHVRSGCPPMFLTQAEDDPISDPANTLIMADACRRAGVPVELHRLRSGGHGFGMGRPGTPTAAWPRWYEDWLHRNGMLM